MVYFEKEKNYVNNDSVKIKTEEGEFEISLEENGYLYIGFYNHINEEGKITFKITKENSLLYALINDFFESFKNKKVFDNYKSSYTDEEFEKMMRVNNPFLNNKITWYSDDFQIQTASILEIYKNNNDESYEFGFSKSKTTGETNTYFVSIANKDGKYKIFSVPFMNLYHNLLVYVRHDEKCDKGAQRTRS